MECVIKSKRPFPFRCVSSYIILYVLINKIVLLSLLQSLWNFIRIIIIEMYRGKNQISSHTKPENSQILNHSLINQSQPDVLQRQVDNYTRKLEQDKRRFFRVQQNHRECLKDQQEKMQQLSTLKSKKFKTETSTMSGKALTLENNLEKVISAYNHALSKANDLKNEIDELRKERKNTALVHKRLMQQMEELKKAIEEKRTDISTKKDNIEKIKQQIIHIKLMNEHEAGQYNGQMDVLKNSVVKDQTMLQKTRFAENKPKTQTVDTLPIVKLRLRNILHRNKEKIRVIEQYKKNMSIIWNAFEEMKEKSGICQLDELTKKILKQEQQEMFTYQFIDKLTKTLQSVNESNKELQNAIDSQKEKNDNYRKVLTGTPQVQKRKFQQSQFIKEKQFHVNQLNNYLNQIQGQLKQTLKVFGITPEEQIKKQNIQQHLSLLEDIINKNIQSSNKKSVKLNEFGNTTIYSKSPPTIGIQQLKQKQDDRLIDNNKLRQYATEYWQKRRGKTGKQNAKDTHNDLRSSLGG